MFGDREFTDQNTMYDILAEAEYPIYPNILMILLMILNLIVYSYKELKLTVHLTSKPTGGAREGVAVARAPCLHRV